MIASPHKNILFIIKINVLIDVVQNQTKIKLLDFFFQIHYIDIISFSIINLSNSNIFYFSNIVWI